MLRTSILIVVFIFACLIVWYAHNVFLIGFAGILFAVFLNAVSAWISVGTKFPYPLVLVSFILALIAVITLIFWISFPLIAEQVTQLFEQLPKAYTQFQSTFGSFFNLHLGSVEAWLNKLIFKNEKFFAQATVIFSFTIETITGFIVFIMVGIYLAFNPVLYVNGFAAAFPYRRQAQVKNIINKIGKILRWWLLGKFISMFAIGILTIFGLWILQVPLAFILGLFAGIFAFIPYIGSILASIPAILIALTISPLLSLYVIALYLVIHALDGYFITPYVEQRTVAVPPALTIMAQVLLLLLVGFLGLALATPLIVVALVLFHERFSPSLPVDT